MIFVTVGTHEQPFNRLIEYMDNLKRNKLIDESIVIQTGYSTYTPQYCTWDKYYSYQQMIQNVNEARIVITHGGPSSFIMPLQIGKIPIVVPRQKQFGEHINDHQVNFTREVAKRTGSIIVVSDIELLGKTINNYPEIIKHMTKNSISNNVKFNEELKRIVSDLF